MSKSIKCPNCQREFAGRPELAGKSVKCPKCGESFRIFASDVDDLFGETEGSFEPTAPVQSPPRVSTPRSPSGSSATQQAARSSRAPQVPASPAVATKPESTNFGIMPKKPPAALWAKLVSFGTVLGVLGLSDLLLQLIGFRLKVMDIFGDSERTVDLAIMLFGGVGVAVGVMLKPR